MVTVIPSDLIREVLDSLTVSMTGLLDGAKVRLFKNAIVPTPATPLSAFTEADYVGYTAGGVLVVWNAAYIGADGLIHLTGKSTQFIAGVLTASETLYGWYAVGDPAGTPFVAGSAVFDSPVQFTERYDGLEVQVDIPLIA